MIIRLAHIPVGPRTPLSTIQLAITEVTKSLGGGRTEFAGSVLCRVVFPGCDDGDEVQKEQTRTAFCELVGEHIKTLI